MSAAILLLILLVVLVRRQISGDGRVQSLDASDGLDAAYALRLPPHELMNRFLAPEDIDFACKQPLPEIRRLFVRERRGLALSWLRQVRSEAGRIIGQHLRAVRGSSRLRPGKEIRLALQVSLFFCMYAILTTLVRIYGPIQLRRIARSFVAMAEAMSNLGRRIASEAGTLALQQAEAAAGRGAASAPH